MANKEYKKNYIGKGKQVKDFEIVKVSINLEQAMACAHEYKGEKYLTFEVAKLKDPDSYGKTHTVYFSEEVNPDEETE